MSQPRSVKDGHLTFWYGIEQGTQEWLDFRKNYATCSNALLICDKGVNAALECNRQHAARKTPNATEHTERGHELEADVKERLADYFNNDQHSLIDCSFITNDMYPLGGYSPDGIIVERATQKFIAPVEVKCFNDWTLRPVPFSSRKEKHYTWKHKLCCEDVKNIPLENRLQFEMEMLMTDTQQVLVVLYNPDAEEGVPVLHIHTYTPYIEMLPQIDEGDAPLLPVPIFRNKLAERLRESLEQSRAVDQQLEKWAKQALDNGIDISWE